MEKEELLQQRSSDRQDGKLTLSKASVKEIEAQIDHIERHLIPLLNSLRAARGKRPVIIPK